MKKILSSSIFLFILGAIIFSFLGTILAYSLTANDIAFRSKDESFTIDNVNDVLEYIHDVSIESLMNLNSSDVNGTYKQAHGTSSNNITASFSKGKYFIFLIYAYGGGIQANNYSSITASGIGLTPTNGTCKSVDSATFESGGNSVAYSSNYRFRNILRFSFYICDFYTNGSISTSTYGTNNYDPDTYVMRYIKIKNYAWKDRLIWKRKFFHLY